VYDVRNGNAIYAVRSPLIEERIQAEQSKPALVGSGHSIFELLFPASAAHWDYDWTEYWAVAGGRRFRVNTAAFQQPLHTNAPYLHGSGAVARWTIRDHRDAGRCDPQSVEAYPVYPERPASSPGRRIWKRPRRRL